MEANPRLRTGVGAVVRLESEPDIDRLLARVAELVAHIPRLRYRAMDRPHPLAAHRWIDTPDIDPADLMVRTSAGGSQTLLDIFAGVMDAAYDRARPLWGIQVVTDLPEGGAAIVSRMHHSLTDGVGAMLIAARFFDADAAGARLIPPDAAQPGQPDPQGSPGRVDALASSIGEDVRGAMSLGYRLASRAAPTALAAVTHPRSTLHRSVDVASSMTRVLAPTPAPVSPVLRGHDARTEVALIDIPLADLKTAGNRLGGSINDVFLAAISRGMRAFHLASGGESVSGIRVGMPLNARTSQQSSAGGNHLLGTRFVLPIADVDAGQSVALARRAAARARSEPALWTTPYAAQGIGRMPTPMILQACTGVFYGLDVVASNVPGPPVPLWCAGTRVTHLHAVAPRNGSGMSATLISYNGRAQVALSMDVGAVGDTALMVASIRQGFDEILAATSEASLHAHAS